MDFSLTAQRSASGRCVCLSASGGLGWRDLRAERWRHEPGQYDLGRSSSTRIVILLKGQAHIQRRCGGRTQLFEADEGVIWLSPFGRGEERVEITGGAVESLHLHLPNRKLSRHFVKERTINADSIELREEGGFRDAVIESIGRSLLREMDEPEPIGAVYVESAAAALDAYLLRRYSQRRTDAVQTAPALGALSEDRLTRTLALIEERLGEALSLKEMAGQTSLSLFHFARAFKASTGIAPHKFILERRVARARDMLAFGHQPIAEIARDCGFASQAHLTNVFKRATGATPAAFRNGAR